MIVKKNMGVRKAAKQDLTPKKHQLHVDGNLIHFPSSLPKKQAQTCFVFVPLRDFGATIIDFIRQQKLLTHSERSVWRELALFAGYDGKCFPAQYKIATRAGIDERTVRKALSGLEQKGFVLKRKPERQRSCSYLLLFHSIFLNLPLGPVKEGGRAAQSGTKGLADQSIVPTIPKDPNRPRTTRTKSDGCCAPICSGELSQEIEDMIWSVAQVKDKPAKWAFAVRERFRRGNGDLEVLKKEAEESKLSSGYTYADWDKWLSELILRDGAEKFSSVITQFQGTHLMIRDVQIPIEYIHKYMETRR
ncbi:helix-turn-helix domain-containing protein [Maridesulfovibrio salexigens]|uniref:Helix-turn-helix domain-containing protein n=1 Tax=Maridesulfovibrio salexigens (strain ATCC 14822 / DSM 2638 / NCIMB 8403 / VKM B-1763) TaxID=526222 RepID=C6BZF9_MARSD|nr:helix-turn-helix domain-containing protein [Maridesulfovibrio salexigens]ACS80796.1 hypothetical protein Desal_2742 [Maridesulfovibrio salexigens DSM 2638]